MLPALTILDTIQYGTNLFIRADILDRMRDILGQRETSFTFLKSLTQEYAAELSEADAVVVDIAGERDATIIGDFDRRGIPVLSV